MIRPDLLLRDPQAGTPRPPQRTVQYASGDLLSRALSGRPLFHFAQMKAAPLRDDLV